MNDKLQRTAPFGQYNFPGPRHLKSRLPLHLSINLLHQYTTNFYRHRKEFPVLLSSLHDWWIVHRQSQEHLPFWRSKAIQPILLAEGMRGFLPSHIFPHNSGIVLQYPRSQHLLQDNHNNKGFHPHMASDQSNFLHQSFCLSPVDRSTIHPQYWG